MRDFANNTTAVGDTVEACPYCDGTQIHKRSEHNVNPDEGPWICYECRKTFFEPHERPARL